MMSKLLLIFQVYFVLFQEGKCSLHYPVSFSDKMSYKGILERHTGCVVNESDCDTLCFDHPDCNSFFYHNECSICQLHNKIFTTSSNKLVNSQGWKYHGSASDCYDIMSMGYTDNGQYKITSFSGSTYDVSCYFELSLYESFAWTIFQRRYDGSVDFYRTWNEYKNGFGNVQSEYWLGNEILHELTSQRTYALSVRLEDFNGTSRYAEYSTFQISSKDTGYTLTVGGYTGDAGDALDYHNGIRFYTKDIPDPGACVEPGNSEGAWWYNRCYACNLNGVYNSGKGMSWYGFHGVYVSLKASTMMIRRELNNNNSSSSNNNN